MYFDVVNQDMDLIKELAGKLHGKSRRQQLYNPAIGDTSMRRLDLRHRNYKVVIDEYKELLSIGVKVESELAFSVNTPNVVFSFKTLKYRSDNLPRLYFRDDEAGVPETDIMTKFWDDLGSLNKKIGLSKNEYAFFYRNGIYFFLHKQKDIVAILDAIIDCIMANPDVFNRPVGKAISAANIPDALKPLLPLLERYAIADDSERSELIEHMTADKKLKLLNTVNPLFQEINRYLDSFETPLSEEAILIGNLAELVSELKIQTRPD